MAIYELTISNANSKKIRKALDDLGISYTGPIGRSVDKYTITSDLSSGALASKIIERADVGFVIQRAGW